MTASFRWILVVAGALGARELPLGGCFSLAAVSALTAPPRSTQGDTVYRIEAVDFLVLRPQTGAFVPLDTTDLLNVSAQGEQLLVRVQVSRWVWLHREWTVAVTATGAPGGAGTHVAAVPVNGPYVAFFYAIDDCSPLSLAIDLRRPNRTVARHLTRALHFVCGD